MKTIRCECCKCVICDDFDIAEQKFYTAVNDGSLMIGDLYADTAQELEVFIEKVSSFKVKVERETSIKTGYYCDNKYHVMLKLIEGAE